MKRRTNQSGFTLLEIMVSISILALMALMISRIFTESTKAVEQGRDQALLDETARLILDDFATDISQAIVRTNIPFRVHTVSVGDALYCISTGVRRKTSTNPRDAAPMRFRSIQRIIPDNNLVPILNRRAAIESASGGTVTTTLMRQSDYVTDQSIDNGDFKTMKNNLLINDGEWFYTDALEETDGTIEQACLTFLDFNINGSYNSNRSADELPSINDLPRFVDLVVGLSTAKDMRMAMRLYAAQGENIALDYLAKHELIYSRRIYLTNRGINRLEFE
ncbi:type II secretion system protein [Pontiellaceae bacterium B12219]|nr:type II secretion system protein [Pontiellaceae bacterium B12219]